MRTTFSIIFLLILCQCTEPKVSSYSEAFNGERKKIGLRTLDSSYSIVLSGNYSSKRKAYLPLLAKIKNLNLQRGLKKPAYYEKYVFLNPKTGEIQFEEDQYVSGIHKPGIDLIFYEGLIYRYVFNPYADVVNIFSDVYHFSDKVTIKNGWEYLYIHPVPIKDTSRSAGKSPYYEQKIDYVTKAKADSILRTWKIKKLNY